LQDNKPIKPDDPPRWQEIMGTQVVIKFVKEQADLNEQAKAALRAIDFGENLVKSGVVMKVDLQTAAELVRLGLAQEVERRYQRNLRDYSYILREFHRRLPLLEDQIANLQKELDYLIQANQEADKHLAEARKQEADMQQELALVNKEREVVGGFRDTLQERLDKTNAEIARLREENQRLAAQLARGQLEAVQGAGRSAAATALAAPSR
jgi:chromosome segregation ATPase